MIVNYSHLALNTMLLVIFITSGKIFMWLHQDFNIPLFFITTEAHHALCSGLKPADRPIEAETDWGKPLCSSGQCRCISRHFPPYQQQSQLHQVSSRRLCSNPSWRLYPPPPQSRRRSCQSLVGWRHFQYQNHCHRWCWQIGPSLTGSS